MKNFVQPGDTITVAAPAATKSGDLVNVGKIWGVATGDAASGAPVEIKLTGVFTLPASAFAATVAGDAAIAAAGVLDDTGTTIGVYVQAKALNATTGVVRLNGVGAA